MVYAGDFNFTPASPMYALVTQGSVPGTEPALPAPYSPAEAWLPSAIPSPLVSAYAQVNGKEPEFTNHTQSANGKFTGTLDYLFLSKAGVRAESVDALPTLAEAEPAPNEHIPSDHWPIAANLVVTCRS